MPLLLPPPTDSLRTPYLRRAVSDRTCRPQYAPRCRLSAAILHRPPVAIDHLHSGPAFRSPAETAQGRVTTSQSAAFLRLARASFELGDYGTDCGWGVRSADHNTQNNQAALVC